MYKHAFRGHLRGVRVSWGGHNPKPFVEGTGSGAVAAADFLRAAYPSHRVARADVACDFCEDGGFEKIWRAIEPIARAARAKVSLVGDPDPASKQGRTIYFGSWSSQCLIRVYEKGLKSLSEGQEADPRWVRLEIMVRPQKAAKSLAATLPPSGFFGFAKWTQQVASDVLHSAQEFIPPSPVERSTALKRLSHMLKQYERTLREVEKEKGAGFVLDQIRGVLRNGSENHS